MLVPNPDYNGHNEVCLVVCDQTGLCDTIKVPVTVTPVNDVPIAVDDMTTADEDTPITINVQQNDTDIDLEDTTLVTTLIGNSSLGIIPVVINDDSISYTPPRMFSGLDTLTYQICDNGMPVLCDTAIVVIIINPVNDALMAIDDINTTILDEPVSGNVLTNDEDQEMDSLFVDTTPLNPMNGTVVIDPQGIYTFTPEVGFIGEATFQYRVCDSGNPSLCDTAIVVIEVIDNTDLDNNAVTGVEDNFTTEAGDPVDGNLLSNDSDPDGDNLVINTTPIIAPTTGTLVINSDGTFTFTPDPNFEGTEHFVYEVCDDGSPTTCDTVAVMVEVLYNDGENDLFATDDAITTTEGASQSGNVVVNDNDPENGVLTVSTTPVEGVDNGTLTLNSDGIYTYVPDTDFFGNDQFTYSICDDGIPQACDTATVYITVLENQHPPIVTPNPITTPQDSTSTICLPIIDLNEGDSFVANPCANTAMNGSVNLTVNDNEVCVTYTPNSGFNGTDDICIIVCDQTGRCDTTIVPVTVTPVLPPVTNPEPPVVIPTPITLPEDSTIMICTPILDANVGDTFMANLCTVSPANGTAVPTVNDDNLCITYTPNTGYIGEDPICVIVCDQTGLCDTTTIPVVVTPTPEPIDSIQPPVVVTPPIVTPEDSVVTTCATIVDANPGDTHNMVICEQPTNGVATASVNNATDQVCITFEPNVHFNGTDSLCIIVCDQTGLCDTINIPIIVLPVNDAPIALDDINNTQLNTPVSGNVLVNDEDPEGDDLTVSATPIGTPTGGTVTINPDGTYDFTPTIDYIGEATFQYEVCDDGAPVQCDTATVVITVIDNTHPDNNGVVGTEDNYTTEEGAPIMGNVASNDSDPDGDDLVINTTPITTPTNGTVVINPDGTFTYTPNTDYFGTDSFTYEVCDDVVATLQSCDTVLVVVEVLPDDQNENNTFATDDSGVGNEDKILTGNVMDNDNDPEGDTQTTSTTPISTPANGTLVINPDGTYEYEPNPGFTGNDVFFYGICDSGAPQACDTGAVYITILEVNEVIAVDDAEQTVVNNPVSGNVLVNDVDPEGDALTVNTTPITIPVGGTVVLNMDGTYTFTPTTDYVGEASFEYEVCDDGKPVVCDAAMVTIDVFNIIHPENNPIIGTEDNFTTEENAPITGSLTSNDNDPDGDSIVINTTPLTTPTNGIVTINTDGTFEYTPTPDFFGMDEFVYEVCDVPAVGTQTCDTVLVTVEVIPDKNENNTFATDDAAIGNEDELVSGDLTANDNDPEGDMQTISTTPAEQPANGTLVIHPDGTFDYQPNPGFTGNDMFLYSICDNGVPQACDTATVNITILDINEAIAVDDISTTAVNTPATGNVLTNDIDPEGNDLIISTFPIGTPVGGMVTINSDGTYNFTPTTDYVGTATFQYQVCDNGMPIACDTAEVVIVVIDNTDADNNSVIGTADNFITEENAPVTGNLVSNDNDPDGDDLIINTTPLTTPTNGTVAINPDGTFEYTPTPDYYGVDEFDYIVCDSGTPQACDTVAVTVEVLPNRNENNTFATDDAGLVNENEVLVGNLTANDNDPEGDTQTISTTPHNSPANGTVTIHLDGTYEYEPNPGFIGNDLFTYQICDNGTPQACDIASVAITVLAVNELLAIDDINATPINTTVNGNVLTNDMDPEGNQLTVSTAPVGEPTNGTVTINPEGTYRFIPTTNFEGIATFEYEVCDNGTPSICDTASVVINVINNVNPNNNTVIGVEDNFITEEGASITASLISNDYDPDGDNLIINTSPNTTPTNGTVTINPDGTFTYTPDSDYYGTDNFEYIVCDDGTPASCDTVLVTVEVLPDRAENTTFATDDIGVGYEDIIVTGNLTANDNDPEGDTQTINTTPVSQPTNGTLIIHSDGTYEYEPNPAFIGNDVFEYTICDDGTPQVCDTATVNLTILEGNELIAINDINTTQTNYPVSGNVLTNDIDPEGDVLTVMTTLVSQPSNGTVTINTDGIYTFTPTTDYIGEATFQYEVCDNGAPTVCDTASVTIQVINNINTTNNQVVGVEDNFITEENAPVTGSLLSNDSDPDGDDLMINTTPLATPTNGTVTINTDGTFEYIPNPDFFGTDNLEYVVCDVTASSVTPSCDTVLVIIEVLPDRNINHTFATDDAGLVNEDEILMGNLVANDNDPEGDVQTINTTPISGTNNNGTLVIHPEGIYTYEPDPGFIGNDLFTYQICDNGTPQACDTATLNITVLAVNEVLALDDTEQTQLNEPVSGNVLTNDEDPEGDALTVSMLPNGIITGGTVDLQPNGYFTFTPDTNYEGEAYFEYQVCDNGIPVACDTAMVVIDVFKNTNPDNNATVGTEDNFTTEAGVAIRSSLISNDNDPDGDILTIDTIPLTMPVHGAVTINPDGTFEYMPNPDYEGTDEFTYEVCDNGTPQMCDEVMVRIAVIPDKNENNTFATDDAGMGNEDRMITGNLIANDNDPEADIQTISSTPVNSPTNGIVVIHPNGTYSYEPNPGFIGNDEFLYEICDNGVPQACDTATVNLTVLSVNELYALNDINATTTNVPVNGNVLTNDYDPEANNLTVNTTLISTPNSGSVIMQTNGDYTFTPEPVFVGEVTFQYQVCDDGAPVVCDIATVVIDVTDPTNPINNEVVGVEDNYRIKEATKLIGNIIGNDYDPDGDILTINTTPISTVTNGTLIINPDGTFEYTPNSDYEGLETFTYEVCDNGVPQSCDIVSVTIDVIPDKGMNTTFATDDANITYKGVSITANVLDNDIDVQGDNQIVTTTPLKQPANGHVNLNADGSYTYTPNGGFIGNDAFVYEVCDDQIPQACSKATVYLTVIKANIRPLIIDPCTCLGNETATSAGQFYEKISILTVTENEVWTMIDNNGGLYDINGQTVIPTNTVATPTGMHNGFYQYVLEGVHIDAIGYNAKFTNGEDTIAVKNTCYYDESCRQTIIIDTDPTATPVPVTDTCALSLIMANNGIPREDTLKCCDAKTTFVDDGAIDGLYKDSIARDDQFTVCAQNQWQVLKYNFSEFGLAAGDALYVYDGKTITSPLIGKFEGEGVSQTGGWVASSCAPSVNPTGCLTFRFVTNGDNRKSIGWNGNFECTERDLTLTPPNNLTAKLDCEETYKIFTISAATMQAACGTVQDSQIVRIYNEKGKLCKDTCLAFDKSFTDTFAIGSYRVAYKLKEDTVKTTEAIMTVQEAALVCNDQVNVPLGSGCSLMLTPDDLLEGGCDTITDTVYYYITLNYTDDKGQIQSITGGGKGGNYPMLTKEMLGQCGGTITATIERRYYEGLNLSFCNNAQRQISCETVVNVIDQSKPVFTNLTAVDTFVTCEVNLTQDGLGLSTPSAIDNCSEATVTFEGATINTTGSEICDTTKATVTWKAVDECGNETTTTQQVVFVRPRLEDIVKTGKVTLACDSEAGINEITTMPSIQIGQLKNGVLIPSDTIPLNTETYTCGYILQQRDVEIPAVDCGRKVFRYWSIVDWCDATGGVQPIDTTFIEYKDTEAPKFVDSSLASTVLELPHHTCELDITKLSQPTATDNCSVPKVVMDAVFRIENGAKWEVPTQNWATLDCDSFEVRWVASDACHEQLVNDTLTQIVLIEDNTLPAAICTDKINVSLSGDEFKLHYRDIDAGSTDACGIAKYEVSRDELNWDSTVTFVCEDAHQAVKVYLRVTDKKGNQNTCWTIVNVEDKIRPICSDLPDMTGTCDEGHNDGLIETDLDDDQQMEESEWVDMTADQVADFNTKYGDPNCSDNVTCSELVIQQQYQMIEKSCGRATIKRRYRAIDWNGEGNTSNWAEQTITIESKADWAITLPVDWKGDCGEEIPNSEIPIKNGACDLLAYEVEEKIFTTVEDACLKVVRTISIINWCNYEAGGPIITISRTENEHGMVTEPIVLTPTTIGVGQEQFGKIEYTQILKLQDETAPSIILESVDNCLEGATCEATKRFAVTATDCNPAENLVYNWTISTENNELASGIGASFDYSVFSKTPYKVSWTVQDNCGNTAWQDATYNFSDCTKPSPYCIHGVAVELMDNGNVQVWAKDVELNSSDNCTDANKLQFRIWHASLGEAPSHIAEVMTLPEVINFNCATLGIQTINLYVIDEDSNWDFCETYVDVQDNMNACTTTEAMAMVAGTIMDWKQQTVEAVQVQATNSAATGTEMMTQDDGQYQFELAMYDNYTIEPTKNDYPLNGVSTFDLVLISKHILGIQQFDNPYQMIAADVNNSGSITAFDMVQTRQLILAIKEEFTNNTSWRFVDAAYEFTTDNPMTEDFPEMATIADLDQHREIDFVAIKIGDVNGNARPSSLAVAEDRTTPKFFEIEVEDRALKAGETYTVEFSTKQLAEIQGYQFTMAYDELSINQLKSGIAGVEHFGLHKMTEGFITTSWNQPLTTDRQQPTVKNTESTRLFSVEFTALKDGKLSEQLTIRNRPTAVEVYDEDGTIMDVQLTFTTPSDKDEFVLFQNEPNPFHQQTNIGFYLPEASEIELILRDETGRVLKRIKENREAGYNTIQLNKEKLSNGFIYYQLNSKFGVKARKMLKLN